MEISSPTIIGFYVSKLMALAPYSINKNDKNFIEIRRSILFTVYSVSLISIMVFLTYRGLLFDANSNIPVRASFRMKSATSKVVTALDVSVVVLSTTAGVFCGVFGLKATQELNKRLRKIDEILYSFSNFKRDRLLSTLMVLIPLILISLLLALDIWTWLRFAIKMKMSNDDTESNVRWYIPFYSLYFLLTGLQINFANTAFGLGRRYFRLNRMLKATFLPVSEFKRNVTKQTITTVTSMNRTSMNLSQVKLNGIGVQTDNNIKHKGMLIKHLAECHENLGKCVALASESYGLAVLFILVSCLLHLVATAYFLFLELLNSKDSGYVWLQILWITFHSCRLLLVVEPCHLAKRESKKTIKIVCEIERKVQDPILAEEIKKFWQQLLVGSPQYSACGLCKVDRNILTSFSSAIATYLVILIQFQKTNG